jgi:ArsR family transcriptional regulator, lead/cadmium/zinc/bismuth-responsive transcriptional repressor
MTAAIRDIDIDREDARTPTPAEPEPDPPDSCGSLVARVALDREEASRVAELFKVLGDPTRVLILQALIEHRELCVHHLAAVVGMSQSSVSHHLRLLRTFRLIKNRRAGREVYYRPDDDHVKQLIGVCVEHLRHAGS